jgi:hypothetical protein
MSGDWRGTLWTSLVTFCIVIIRCTETFWSPCTHKRLQNIRAQNNNCWTLKALLPIETFKTTRTITQRHIPQHIHFLNMHVTILLPLFLGPMVKLWKATISFVKSVRLSARMKQLGFHWTDFHEIWNLSTFRKSVEKFTVALQSDTNTATLH